MQNLFNTLNTNVSSFMAMITPVANEAIRVSRITS
jgi:hypothetical protein